MTTAICSEKEIRLIAKQRMTILRRISYNRDLMEAHGGKASKDRQYLRGLEVAEQCLKDYDENLNSYLQEEQLDASVWDLIYLAQTNIRQGHA